MVAAGKEPVDHYLNYGRLEGRFPNALAEQAYTAAQDVDPNWYAARYPDVVAAGKEPVDHYLNYGRLEGRFPNALAEQAYTAAQDVDPDWYAARYPDVVAAGKERSITT